MKAKLILIGNLFLKKPNNQKKTHKKMSFSSSANSQYFSQKFQGLVLGWKGLIDANGSTYMVFRLSEIRLKKGLKCIQKILRIGGAGK